MQLLHGGQLFLSGVKLALSPTLRRYVWVPVLIGVVIFSLTLTLVVVPLGANAGDWLPIVAPSANREVLHRGFPRAMDEADILRIVGDFATAARICREAGLDGLEIIASGHLMDQFWSPVTNQRTDSYGGSMDNRMRYSRMVFEAMRL